MTPKLILASGSTTRHKMLTDAGVSFDVQKPAVDEEAVKAALIQEGASPRDIADALGDLKARSVAMMHPDAYVLGSDQILVEGKRIFSKAENRAQAKETLQQLSGKSHYLISSAVIYQGGQAIWRTLDQVKLTMRPLGDAFIEDYLDQIGDAAFWSVGSYQIEGRGAQLFTRVDGSHFTVLGMPLLPVLDFLRLHGFLKL